MLVDQGNRADRAVIKLPGPARFRQQPAVHRIDDLHVARQQPLEQRHWPALQRLGQQGVVGIAEGAAGNVPPFVEVQPMIVEQNAHQFSDRNRRMGVIKLDRRLVRQRPDVAEILNMPTDNVL